MNEASERELAFFSAARRLPACERAGYLDEACAGDAALRQRVEELLVAGDEAGGFLQEPASEAQRRAAPPGSPSAQTAATLAEKAGDRIGRYRLLQQIGEGGCGTVYMAEQEEPVRRRVALKVIKLGMDTNQVIARFEAERQALALMDNPNIAKVLDAGATESGRPYFVMELVKGIPITRYCDENNLTTALRLGLFVQVCQAIQHAHQKGIIHRDIKPSNILVTDHDGVPVPKIIDFGIAKATSDQRLTDKTLFTAFEQFIGTPAYMSPEQAKLSGLDIDTRSDIYSLGVLLYELLTGKTPFEAKRLLEAGLDEIRRIIREEEPVRPSTRVHTLDAAEQTTVAKHRQSEPPKLVHLIRGDLDWIVMKALEKERGRRYETANGLAMDIQRHLNSEPVVARAPSHLYRFQKLVQRNKVIVTAAACVLIALGLGVLVSTWLAIRSTQAEHAQSRLRAEAEKARADETNQRQRAERALAQVKLANYQANLQAADAYLNAHEVEEAQRRLKACDPELRNWEWKHLNLKSDSSLRNLCRSKSSIRCFSVSPDEKWIAVGLENGVAIWDAESQVQKSSIESMKEVSCLAFSADSKLLAAGSTIWPDLEGPVPETVKVRVWQIEPLKEISAYTFPNDEAAMCLAFDHAGRSLLVGSGTWTHQVLLGKGELRTCELDLEHKIKVLGEDPQPIKFVGMTQDGERIVSIGKDVKTWDAASGKMLQVRDATPEEIRQLVGSGTGLLISDSASEKVRSLLREHPDVRASSISPDRMMMVTGSNDKTIQVWDLNKATLQHTFLGHLTEVKSVAFLKDGLRVVSLGAGAQELKEWDLTRGGNSLKLENDWGVSSVVFTPKGRTLITADNAGAIKVWGADTGALLATLYGRGGSINCMALSSDGTRLAVADRRPGIITVWDVPAEKIHHAWNTDRGRITALAFSPDGRQLASASNEGSLSFWDPESGAPRADVALKVGSFPCVTYSPDGKTVAAAGWSGSIHIFDSSNGQLLHVLGGGQSQINTLAYHPNSLQIASAGGRVVSIWDVRSQKVIAQLQGSEDGVNVVAYSPDGTRLASGGGDADKTVRVWDTETKDLLLTLRGHTRFVTSIAFNPDGTRIASASADSVRGNPREIATRHDSVLIWETEPAADHAEARRTSALLCRTVESLVEKLFTEHLLMTNVLERLKQDTSLSQEVREAASRMARAREMNDMENLNHLAWEVVAKPGQPTEAYQQALRQAKAVCATQPTAGYLNTLGVAQFRAGQFEEALATLKEADRLNQGLYQGSYIRAIDLLFIAMCHKQLGHMEAASATLAEAQVLAKSFAGNAIDNFLREATAFMGKERD